MLRLPRNLVDAADRDGRQAWLATLPDIVRGLEKQWSLTIGPPFQPGGQTAWVGPARDPSRRELVLKVMWRHPEAAHEADGLRVWDGDGAVRLQAVEDFAETQALLLERCLPGTPLAGRPEPEQDVVIASLLPRLWREPPPWLMIAPKPHVGDPTYDVLQHMLNCGERLQANPRRLAGRMADLACLDAERVLLWLFAHCVQESADWPDLALVARRLDPA
jgi:streptomycin 6-kinase